VVYHRGVFVISVTQREKGTAMKRFAIFATVMIFLLNTCVAAAYENGSAPAPVQKQVMFWLTPDIAVELNEVRLVFKDVNGQAV
jgi:hypothetical protein